jgi:hypothetical protein
MGLLDAVSEASVPRTSERSRRGARRLENIPDPTHCESVMEMKEHWHKV